MDLFNALQWRYATKRMNGNIVPQEKVDYVLDAARLAPSSSGLQPFEIIVISDKELLEKVKPAAMNQPQITEASHLLVFAAWDNYTTERINEVFTRMNAERGLPDAATDDYRNMLIGIYTQRPASENFNHAARQAYISLGVALIAAADQQVDATPMEGFNNDALDELLGLNAKGLKSAVIMTLGYRDTANDWLVNLKKVRTPKEQFITELK
jgi:nitroreductase / dihydropteridine reductase